MIWNTFNSCSSSLKTHTHLHVMWRSIKTDIDWLRCWKSSTCWKTFQGPIHIKQKLKQFLFQTGCETTEFNRVQYTVCFVTWIPLKGDPSLPTRIIDPLQQAVYWEASWKRLNSLAESGQVLVLCTRCSDQSLMQAFNLVANLPFWLFKPENVDLLLTIYRPL
jgi:hypothetical protein